MKHVQCTLQKLWLLWVYLTYLCILSAMIVNISYSQSYVYIPLVYLVTNYLLMLLIWFVTELWNGMLDCCILLLLEIVLQYIHIYVLRAYQEVSQYIMPPSLINYTCLMWKIFCLNFFCLSWNSKYLNLFLKIQVSNVQR
jgi:hypothetical protein